MNWFGLILLACLLGAVGSSSAGKAPDRLHARPFELSVDYVASSDPKAVGLDEIWGRLMTAPQRDAYETTVEYDARMAEWKKRWFDDDLKSDGLMAIPVDERKMVSRRYDADAGRMYYVFDVSDAHLDLAEPFVVWKRASETLPSGSGKTVMGIRFSWTRSDLTERGVVMKGIGSRYLSFDISPSDARQLSSEILFVGRITDYSTFGSYHFHRPTLSERWETFTSVGGWTLDVEQIWIVNSATRRAIAKLCRTADDFSRCEKDKAPAADQPKSQAAGQPALKYDLSVPYKPDR